MTDPGSGQDAKSVAVIVAHPDDEILWTGGTILSQPAWDWFIITLSRASDRDRAPRFFQTLKALGAEGTMADLDDGPEQTPLAETELQETILGLLPKKHFDFIISHSPAGEYTRHRRHEEIGRAVITLWSLRKISTDVLWLFAYEDGGKQYLPRPIETADIYRLLPEQIWQRKYSLITDIYGFEQKGFEAETTPRAEAFWQFTNPMEAQQWLAKKVFPHEGPTLV
ncbi:MAG TPA: PIG-L family deacetylase [Anaerolineales bacterium]|nr:PIG-L family deacetylase [Anaerolineales bacterium]